MYYIDIVLHQDIVIDVLASRYVDVIGFLAWGSNDHITTQYTRQHIREGLYYTACGNVFMPNHNTSSIPCITFTLIVRKWLHNRLHDIVWRF